MAAEDDVDLTELLNLYEDTLDQNLIALGFFHTLSFLTTWKMKMKRPCRTRFTGIANSLHNNYRGGLNWEGLQRVSA